MIRGIKNAGYFCGVLFLAAALRLTSCYASSLDLSQQEILEETENSQQTESQLYIPEESDSSVDYETILEREQQKQQAEARKQIIWESYLESKKEALIEKKVREARIAQLQEEKEEQEAQKKEEFRKLKKQINAVLQKVSGDWSVYVKDLKTDAELSINSHSVYAASLIKLYVMEYCYANMDSMLENCSFYSSDKAKRQAYVEKLLTNMIKVSDNESYNQLVRLQSASRSFKEGCAAIEEYVSDKYSNTDIYHVLQPSSSRYETLGGSNQTSVADCGALLEAIYRGECVSEEASESMLALLLQQTRTSKIPAGISADVKIANKTGETSATQHDAAIVFGTDTDYVICVMSKNASGEGGAISTIRKISELVYDYLNEE